MAGEKILSPDSYILRTSSGEDVATLVFEANGEVRLTLRSGGGQQAASVLASREKQEGRLLNTLSCEGGPVNSLAWHPQGKFVLSAENEGFTMWDISKGWKGVRYDESDSPESDVQSCLFHPHHRTFVTGGFEEDLWIHRFNDDGSIQQAGMGGHGEYPNTTALCWAKDPETLFLSDNDGKLCFYTVPRTGTELSKDDTDPWTLREWGVPIHALCRADDRLFCALDDGSIGCVDIDLGSIRSEVAGEHVGTIANAHEGPATGLALLNKHVLLSCGTDGKLHGWNVDSGEEWDAYIQNVNERSYRGIAVHPNGKYVATVASDETTVVLWHYDTSSRDELVELEYLEGHTGPVNSIAWSPDGTQLVSGGHDETMRIWDTSDLS